MNEKEMMKHAKKICDLLQDNLALKPFVYGEPLKGVIPLHDSSTIGIPLFQFTRVDQYCKENNLSAWLDIEDIINEELWLEIMESREEE